MLMFETVEAQVGQLSLAVRKLSMIGAALKIHKNPDVDSRIRSLIIDSFKSALGKDVEALDEREASTLVRMIRMSFAEAGELLHDPARPPKWQVVDPELLRNR
jgi:hypothetical protein